ncbi:unnamed protein product [Rhizophagus irregularis]|nr:unnamed protein product [Rhizophagus irregularis]
MPGVYGFNLLKKYKEICIAIFTEYLHTDSAVNWLLVVNKYVFIANFTQKKIYYIICFPEWDDRLEFICGTSKTRVHINRTSICAESFTL